MKPKPQPWSAEEEKELARLYRDHPASEVAELMGRSFGSVTSRIAVLRLRKPAGHRVVWTPEMDAALIERYPHEKTAAIAAHLGLSEKKVYTRANTLDIKKSAKMRKQLAREAADRLTELGRRTRFKPGQETWNKGINFQPGGRSIETRFKKGERRGQAALNYRPIGSHRISKDGYLERKTNDHEPVPTHRWEAVHRLVWEETHGPIPPKHTVRFKPGCFTTEEELITADKLECISMADNMRRNSIQRYGRDYHSAASRLSWFKRKLNQLEKEHENAE